MLAGRCLLPGWGFAVLPAASAGRYTLLLFGRVALAVFPSRAFCLLSHAMVVACPSALQDAGCAVVLHMVRSAGGTFFCMSRVCVGGRVRSVYAVFCTITDVFISRGLMFSASGAVDWVCQWLTARLSGQVGAVLIVLGCCHNATGLCY